MISASLSIDVTGTSDLRDAACDSELLACWPVIQQLRPNLNSANDFAACFHPMVTEGYRLLAAWKLHAPQALAGYRLQKNVVYRGRSLFIDDLVTDDPARGAQWGTKLIEAITRITQGAECGRLVLDPGLANARAQRFFFRPGLLTKAIRFRQQFAQGPNA